MTWSTTNTLAELLKLKLADKLVIWSVMEAEVAPKNNFTCVPSHPLHTLPSNNNVAPVVAGQIILGTPKMV